MAIPVRHYTDCGTLRGKDAGPVVIQRRIRAAWLR
jgi:hypothetical protein